MLLLSGPPGSGKTHSILEQVRAALRRDAADFRLVVPAASMAESLRNRLAREGFAVRPGLIVTLGRFAGAWVTDIPAMTGLDMRLLVAKALAESCPREFAAAAGNPGFRSLVADLIAEFSSEGYESRHIARALGKSPPDAPLAPAFLRLYEEIEKLICSQLTVPEHMRLRRAADDVRSHRLGRIRRVFFDGFHTFSRPELDFLHAVRAHAGITIALPRWPGAAQARSALLAMGLEEVELEATVHRFPVRHVVSAPDMETEAEEIARRIVDHVDTGRQLRDIAVVMRSREPYLPVLREALERHGIPACFHFAEPLAGHAVVRYFTGAVEAMLGGWKHEDVLRALRMTISGVGNTPACDRFDFAVRERLPGAGLSGLRALSGDARIGALLDRLSGLDAWPGSRALPSEWAARMRELRSLVRVPEITDRVSRDTAALWRSEASALNGFFAAAEEAAAAFTPQQPLAFGEYWDALAFVLATASLDANGERWNAVHVMDVPEAAHREFPVVFVCGLMEGSFPAPPPGDPIFSDAARARLCAAGLHVRTAASHRDREEYFFEIATTRASSELVLSYAARDEHGEPALPSFFLGRFIGLDAEPCAPMAAGPAAPCPEPDTTVRDERLLAVLEEASAAAGADVVMSCPFRFFIRHTLGLESHPPGPRERMTAQVERAILGEAAAAWLRHGGPPGKAFDQAFQDVCARLRVLPGSRAALARVRLMREWMRVVSAAGPAARRMMDAHTRTDPGERPGRDGDLGGHVAATQENTIAVAREVAQGRTEPRPARGECDACGYLGICRAASPETEVPEGADR